MRDLRDDLTVFVVYSGELDMDACLDALEAQNCRFRLSVIDHVAPMDRAFQEMLDRCRTPFYIQVDADMVLTNRGALLTMAEDIRRCPPEVALVCYPLHDPHLDHLIFGCKVYRHEVLRRYPYTASYSCEVGQIESMQRDGYAFYSRWPTTLARFDEGYTMVRSALVVGEHSPTWTPDGIFVRYKRLAQKYRRFGYLWVESLARRFFSRVQSEGAAGVRGVSLDGWALAGFLAGMTGPLDEGGEDDYRDADQDYSRLEGMLWPSTS